MNAQKRHPMNMGLFIILLLITVMRPMAYGAEEQVEEETTSTSGDQKSEKEAVYQVPEEQGRGTALYAKDIHHRRPKIIVDLVEALNFRFSSYLTTQYVSFGQPFSEGAVWQPSGSVEYRGLGFNIWANFVLDNEPNQGQFNEVDLTLYYDLKLGNFTIHPFMVVVFYPNADPASLDYSNAEDYEPSLHMAYALGPFDLFVDATLYLVRKPGRFKMKTGLGYRKMLYDGVRVNTYLLLGFANGRYNQTPETDPGTRLNYFEYSFELIFRPWGKGFSVKPNIQFSNILPDALRKTADDPTIVWGGVELVYEF